MERIWAVLEKETPSVFLLNDINDKLGFMIIDKIKSTIAQIPSKSLIKTMLLGATIGLILISLLVFSVKHPNPDWGKWWFIRPLIITPLVASLGSLSFYLKYFIQPQSILMRVFIMLLSTIAFIFTLWVGIILGLDGTLWD
jgi:hypothetical protein